MLLIFGVDTHVMEAGRNDQTSTGSRQRMNSVLLQRILLFFFHSPTNINS